MPKAAKAPRSSTRKRGDRESKSASKPSGPGNSANAVNTANAARKSVSTSDRETQIAVQASDKLYYRIGEVSELTSVKAHVLRYWETEFRWMAPPKSRSKQRLYRKRDIEFVLLLKRLLWEERYTIAGARQRIQDLGVEGALALLSEPPKADQPEDKVASGDWIAFRAAIDEMRDELVVVRGVLQESA
jgi:DNA-binding transcriptional MerR regulator